MLPVLRKLRLAFVPLSYRIRNLAVRVRRRLRASPIVPRTRPLRQRTDYTSALVRVTLAALVAFALGTESAGAETESYQIDATRTRVEYGVVEFGFIAQHGRFGQVNGSLALNKDTKSGRIEFVVDATSVDTGWSVRDAFVRGDGMLDVERYPEIRFRSTRVEWNADRPARVHGALTLHGITRPIVLDLKTFACEPRAEPRAGEAIELCRAIAGTTIQRSQFEMTSYVPIVSDDVTATRAVAETTAAR